MYILLKFNCNFLLKLFYAETFVNKTIIGSHIFCFGLREVLYLHCRKSSLVMQFMEEKKSQQILVKLPIQGKGLVFRASNGKSLMRYASS